MNDIADFAPPTSTADTRATEPEVVAGISSAEGSPDMPLSIRTAPPRYSLRAMLMLAAGLGAGFAAAGWLRRR